MLIPVFCFLSNVSCVRTANNLFAYKQLPININIDHNHLSSNTSSSFIKFKGWILTHLFRVCFRSIFSEINLSFSFSYIFRLIFIHVVILLGISSVLLAYTLMLYALISRTAYQRITPHLHILSVTHVILTQSTILIASSQVNNSGKVAVPKASCKRTKSPAM